jgi:AcrR family transcriptional regulator
MTKRKSAREAILDAAERVFARYGYDGATMRQIAAESGTAQALLHYHFKSKDNLYDAMFSRRSAAINSIRSERLDALLSQPVKPSLEQVLSIFLPPAKSRNDGGAFSQIVSAAAVGNDARSKRVMMKYYDQTAKRFISAFLLIMPEIKPQQAVWAYLFALGARMQAHARNGRADRLIMDLAPTEQIMPADGDLLAFTAAGIRELLRTASARAAASPVSVRRRKRKSGGHAV